MGKSWHQRQKTTYKHHEWYDNESTKITERKYLVKMFENSIIISTSGVC